MNFFFTFCFDIGRINRHILIKSLQGLINSLDCFNNTYKLTVYTNISELSSIINNINVSIINYELSNIKSMQDIWYDLNYHRLFMANDICTEDISPIWIDIDTIICKNIDHLSRYESFFIMQGGDDIHPFHITDGKNAPNNIYIQGNVWKINRHIIDELYKILSTIKTKIEFDAQGLFNYAYHFTNLKSKMNILGKDIDIDTINGLSITSNSIIRHPRIDLLKDKLFMNENGLIIDKETGKNLQFFSFTFYTLESFIVNNSFMHFSDNGVKNFFIKCGY